MAPPIRTKSSFPSVSLSHQEASVGLLSSGRSVGLVAKSCPTLATPWTVACLALLSVGFSRQEYWSGLPFSYPPSEGKQTENHNHRKLTNLITWTTALSNSVKLWVMPYRATQEGHVMVESSDKVWSTGEGNGKALQYSCFEKPMNDMKRQKDRTLKDKAKR